MAEHPRSADVVEQVVVLAALADRAGTAVGAVEVFDVKSQDFFGIAPAVFGQGAITARSRTRLRSMCSPGGDAVEDLHRDALPELGR